MDKCNYKDGRLPECAPLALAYVPMQESVQPSYDGQTALARGTLFPGLDLPFMNVVNKPDNLSTPLCELMALDFVVQELKLYLDTHPADQEAFALLQQCIRMSCEGRKRYVELYGPITIDDMLCASSFDWIDNPWPWQQQNETEG